MLLNPFSANFKRWSNTLKQFVGNLPTNCLSVFYPFVTLALRGLTSEETCDYLTLTGDNRMRYTVIFIYRQFLHILMTEDDISQIGI